jgi:hypothetical protein
MYKIKLLVGYLYNITSYWYSKWLYLPPIGYQSGSNNLHINFMQGIDYQTSMEKVERNTTQTPNPSKVTDRASNGVGEWPPLLTKKWLAAHYGCLLANGSINLRRFRAQVLTAEVLQRAGIPPEIAYSRSTKTFNAIYSMSLTTILRGFCLAFLLTITATATAQTVATVPATLAPITVTDPVVTRPVHVPVAVTTILDTLPGVMVVSDSIIRMVQDPNGSYRYQRVLSTLVFDGWMVKEFQLTAGTQGGQKLLGHRFYHEKWGIVDPKRVLLFKTNQ